MSKELKLFCDLETAADIACALHRRFLVLRLEEILDEGLRVRHCDFAREAEYFLADPRFIYIIKLLSLHFTTTHTRAEGAKI